MSTSYKKMEVRNKTRCEQNVNLFSDGVQTFYKSNTFAESGSGFGQVNG